MQSQGDSLILLPGEKIGLRVRAKVGMRLHYLCAIHPWMQGTIRVTRTGTAPTPLAAGSSSGRVAARRLRRVPPLGESAARSARLA